MPKRRKVRIFQQLKESLESALAYERGENPHVRVTFLPDIPKTITPREVRAIRKSLKVSQTRFAVLLNVSPKAVQSWEQGERRPRSAALKLLYIAKKNPKVLLVA
ncbi:MAG TPA: helix-turn-helix domain-containing protein [Candidatus Acidoferrales bacterium]|jgi:DNA-binding transcriptional regulator YiaG|nr:helix-turn-helix domain-containing protein [Candidatus Acidoferrales bacterium]